MSNCSKHKKELLGLSMPELAVMVGDLHYEELDKFFDHLAVKLHGDGVKDFAAGRKRLGCALQNAALYIQKAGAYSKEAWLISEPFMNEGK